MNKKIKIITFIIPFLLLLVTGVASGAEAKSSKLKAAYILNFARFVYWPDEIIQLSETFNICIIGSKEIYSSFKTLTNKKIKNRNIKIEYVTSYERSLACRILYISKTKKSGYVEIIKKTLGDVVLTVSDISGFYQKYGMIEFVSIKNKIKFKINVTRSLKSKIKYRSQLLEVAASLK